ncbi:MAG: glycosyltransferase family 2 protein [Lachnospiraceae bacterium]
MKLSIITINYNNCDGLRRTIESVVNQTCRDFEYIIIDGGSTDGSVDVIKKYASQIDYWVSEPDKGIYNAMNKGVAVAKGEYCLFMNSGDCLYKSNVIHDVLAHGLDADVVTGGIEYADKNIYFAPSKVSMRHFYRRTLFHQATFISTEVLRHIPYDESLTIASDWKFFIEAIVVNGFSYSPMNIIIADMEAGGRGSNVEVSKKEHSKVLHELLPEYVFADYDVFLDGEDDYDRFYKSVKHSRFKRLIFVVNYAFLKLVYLGRPNCWLSKYSIRKKM